MGGKHPHVHLPAADRHVEHARPQVVIDVGPAVFLDPHVLEGDEGDQRPGECGVRVAGGAPDPRDQSDQVTGQRGRYDDIDRFRCQQVQFEEASESR